MYNFCVFTQFLSAKIGLLIIKQRIALLKYVYFVLFICEGMVFQLSIVCEKYVSLQSFYKAKFFALSLTSFLLYRFYVSLLQ